MTSGKAQQKATRPTGGLFGFVTSVFTRGMQSAQKLSETAVTLPWDILEGMGVPEDRTRGPKEFNLKLVGGVFGLTNRLADRVLDAAAVPARWLGADARSSAEELPAQDAPQRRIRQAPANTTLARDAHETTNSSDDGQPTASNERQASTKADDRVQKTQNIKFNFTPNAEAIYNKSISATPLPFRRNTRDGLNALLLERFGETAEIGEADMVEVIRAHTPRPFLAKGMKAIKPLLSDPSLAD